MGVRVRAGIRAGVRVRVRVRVRARARVRVGLVLHSHKVLGQLLAAVPEHVV